MFDEILRSTIFAECRRDQPVMRQQGVMRMRRRDLEFTDEQFRASHVHCSHVKRRRNMNAGEKYEVSLLGTTFQMFAKNMHAVAKVLGTTLGLRLGYGSEFKYEEHMNGFNDGEVRERTIDDCAEIGCSLL